MTAEQTSTHQVNATTFSKLSDREMVMTRVFDAPRELVFKAYTDPDAIPHWWGPRRYATIVDKMDVRVGGTRLVCMEMQTPNGPMQMWFTGEYREVLENERLVYTESMSDENGNVMTPSDMNMPEEHSTTTEVRVELEDVGGRTKMVMTHVGIPSDSPGAAGWTMALDKLAVRIEAHSNR